MIRRAGLLAIAIAAASCTAELDVLRPDDGVCLDPGYACGAPEDCCSAQCEASMCVEPAVCREAGGDCDVDEDCCSQRCQDAACVEPPVRS